jgi:hypothetical protein
LCVAICSLIMHERVLLVSVTLLAMKAQIY